MELVNKNIDKKISNEFPTGLSIEHINSHSLYHRCDTRHIGKNLIVRVIHNISDYTPDISLIAPDQLTIIPTRTLWHLDNNHQFHKLYKKLWN
jgi:hypothetical protein